MTNNEKSSEKYKSEAPPNCATMSDSTPPPSNLGPNLGKKRRQNRSRKPKNETKGLPGTKNAPGSSQSSNKRASHKSNSSKSKERDIKHDYRYQEILKLMKKYKPIAINGVSIDVVVKNGEKDHQTHVNENDLTLAPIPPKETSSLDVDSIKPEKSNGNQEILNTKNTSEHYVHKYIAKLVKEGNPIYLLLHLIPSDPEFPYDLDVLKLSLCVPPKYPYDRQILPTIYVLNDEIPRGFASSIESGFREISLLAAGQKEPEEDGIKLVKGRGLLSQIQTLNNNLEIFLREERKEVVKLVKRKKKVTSTTVSREATPFSPEPELASSKEVKKDEKKMNSTVQTPVDPTPVTKEGKQLRERLISDMKSKIPCKLFTSKENESVYKVELPVRRGSRGLPVNWTKLDTRLHIPSMYPEENAWVTIPLQLLNKISKKETPPNATATELSAIAKESMNERMLLVKAAKQFEANFRNIPSWIECLDLITLLNFAATNAGALCMEKEQCNEHFQMMVM